ncbi:glycosyltransferase [Lactobacillus curvatus]|uniref:glycosyltransferase family 4 protein n=1 Tax=Latilactobacillus fragifolii TaxID=2814244 RepID=UPI0012AFA65A|nr:glycosyltransferase family 4 protein [Latilactobacillus fragifolii]MSD84656.1 glycosyltransferase [Latilactobacillus curvatus]MSE24622.1 glycosyltransferase [Latilactobacillus curvatus]
MNIGIFTDTYFPQVSGVATSIKTLKEALEKQGHSVYIFTTTDPHVDKEAVEPNIFRFASVPFVSFTDRRIAVRGLFHAYQVAKELDLDIVHTQTEFSMGYIGKFVAKNLKIPCLHTYHTMYEDYLHYVLNGKLLRPYHVKQMSKAFLYHMSGIVAPSKRVSQTLNGYQVKAPIRIIPTGVDISRFEREVTRDIRTELGLTPDQPVLLSLSRVAYEKRIDILVDALPKLVAQTPDLMLVIVGEGPAREDLEAQVAKLNMTDHVIFTGMVDNDEVANYYHMADLFVSASDSESQGLTYIEAMAAELKIVVMTSPYAAELLTDPSIGTTFTNEDEMIHQVSNYLNHPHAFDDPAPRQKKLHAISADYFAEQMIHFYKQSQLLYAELKLDQDDLLELEDLDTKK